MHLSIYFQFPICLSCETQIQKCSLPKASCCTVSEPATTLKSICDFSECPKIPHYQLPPTTQYFNFQLKASTTKTLDYRASLLPHSLCCLPITLLIPSLYPSFWPLCPSRTPHKRVSEFLFQPTGPQRGDQTYTTLPSNYSQSILFQFSLNSEL